MTASVRLESLVKEFPGGVRALDDINLTVQAGEFFALLGPSGCGKTTMLRTIAGLENATSGSIYIEDRDVTALASGKRNVAMVFQDYALYPHMTVLDNVAYPLKVRKMGKGERHSVAAEAAGNLQLDALLERRPGQLSGGQQQRVALARAVAYHANVFLFDEPLSNLDARLRLEARTYLKRLQKDLGVTTVYVTHDQSEALALADRIAVMESGHIRQLDSPAEVYERPATVFVASFIGSTPMNLLSGEVRDGSVRIEEVDFPIPPDAAAHVSEGEEVVLGFRPERTAVSGSGAGGEHGIDGEVAVVELLGVDHLVTIERGDVTVQAVTREPPEVGDRAWLVPELEHTLLYRASDGGLVGSERLDVASEAVTGG